MARGMMAMILSGVSLGTEILHFGWESTGLALYCIVTALGVDMGGICDSARYYIG